MTDKVCLDLVRDLEGRFQAELPHEELNSVWSRLLACKPKALGIAVNLARRRHKVIPTPEQLARMTEKQQELLTAREQKVGMPDEVKRKLQRIVGKW